MTNAEKPGTILRAVASCTFFGRRTSPRSPRSVSILVGVPGGNCFTKRRTSGCRSRSCMSCVTLALVNRNRRASSARFRTSPVSKRRWNSSAVATSVTTFGTRRSASFTRFRGSGKSTMTFATPFSHSEALGSPSKGRRRRPAPFSATKSVALLCRGAARGRPRGSRACARRRRERRRRTRRAAAAASRTRAGPRRARRARRR